jgi:hypothetical protein
VVEGLGGRVEVDVEGGAAVELEVGDEGRAEGGLGDRQISSVSAGAHERNKTVYWVADLTLPAPAGPMTMAPNLLMMGDHEATLMPELAAKNCSLYHKEFAAAAQRGSRLQIGDKAVIVWVNFFRDGVAFPN